MGEWVFLRQLSIGRSAGKASKIDDRFAQRRKGCQVRKIGFPCELGALGGRKIRIRKTCPETKSKGRKDAHL
jgi:hypothetical protein